MQSKSNQAARATGKPAKGLFGSGDTKTVGDLAEDQALAYLQGAGLRLVQRHYRTPGRGGGEIDLIMRDSDGTLVFVEVRARRSLKQGGAAATVGFQKQQRIVLAARHFLLRLPRLPACRFDVLALDGEQWQWLKGAFELA